MTAVSVRALSLASRRGSAVPEDASDTTRRDCLCHVEDVADRFRFQDDRCQSSADLEKSFPYLRKSSHDLEKSSHDRKKSSHDGKKSSPVLSKFSAVLERSLHALFRLRADR
jgi:hypothetical protein